MYHTYTFTQPMNLSFKGKDGERVFFATTDRIVTMQQKTKRRRIEANFVESIIEVLYSGEIRLFLEGIDEECIFGEEIEIYCNPHDGDGGNVEDVIVGELMKLNDKYAIMKSYLIR